VAYGIGRYKEHSNYHISRLSGGWKEPGSCLGNTSDVFLCFSALYKLEPGIGSRVKSIPAHSTC
jgi:hypothetical protein